MAQPDSIPAPRSFPDLSLAITYEQALEYVQLRLNMFGRGELKPFCEEHKLSYPTTVNLKNNKLKEQQPRLVLKLLNSLAVVSELIRHPTQDKKPHFLFPTREALATFQEQLTTLQSS
jgi:hypothetical protein